MCGAKVFLISLKSTFWLRIGLGPYEIHNFFFEVLRLYMTPLTPVTERLYSLLIFRFMSIPDLLHRGRDFKLIFFALNIK